MNPTGEIRGHKSIPALSPSHTPGDERTAPPFEVLVVSSDLALQCHVSDVLASLGINPVRVSTVRECERILAERRIGLVFCAAGLMDGSYRDLLGAYPAAASRPRVVVTSRTADWDEYVEAMHAGAFDIISVPCRRMDVEWMVIQARRAARENEGIAATRLERVGVKAASASGSSRTRA